MVLRCGWMKCLRVGSGHGWLLAVRTSMNFIVTPCGDHHRPPDQIRERKDLQAFLQDPLKDKVHLAGPVRKQRRLGQVVVQEQNVI